MIFPKGIGKYQGISPEIIKFRISTGLLTPFPMKWIRRILIGLALFIGLAILGFMIGPRKTFPDYDNQPTSLDLPLEALETYVTQIDAPLTDLKPNNHGRIIWADSIRKTPYVVLYLHGYSASPMESEPVHMDIARTYGCNLYIPRLRDHGRWSEESFVGLEPGQLVADAKEAIAMAHLLGDSVILMGCSTGATLGTYLTAADRQRIAALVYYSPNFRLYDPATAIMTGPWGVELTEALIGTHREVTSLKGDSLREQYTTTTYHTNGLIALQSLLDHTMTPEIFAQIDLPYFIGYYYKNEEEMDHTISVEAIKEFDSQTHTPASHKRLEAFPNVETHVIASNLQSSDVASVYRATASFLEEVIGLRVVDTAFVPVSLQY